MQSVSDPSWVASAGEVVGRVLLEGLSAEKTLARKSPESSLTSGHSLESLLEVLKGESVLKDLGVGRGGSGGWGGGRVVLSLERDGRDGDGGEEGSGGSELHLE